MVEQGTPFSVYSGELRLLLANVYCVGPVEPEDGTLQLAIKASIDDQYAGLSAQIFAGRNMSTVPFGNVDELMAALDDLALNQSVASQSTKMNGGGGRHMVTRSQTHAKAFHSQKFGGIMAVDSREAENVDENLEFEKVYVVLQSRGGFGRNNNEPALLYTLLNKGSQRCCPESLWSQMPELC